MAGIWRAVAAGILLAIAYPGTGAALRVVPGSFQVRPSQVQLTRTITLTLALEDETGTGGRLSCRMAVEPPGLMRLMEETRPWISCTSVEQSRGRWVYEALAPGEAKFTFSATLYTCSGYGIPAMTVESASAAANPPKVWSKLELSPRILSPGEKIDLALILRNDGQYPISYRLPQVQPESVGSVERPVVEMAGVRKIDPASAIRGHKFELAPGDLLRSEWSFLALAPGEAKFLVTGAGIIVMSPPILVRHAPVLDCMFAPPSGPAAVGKSYELTGRIRSRGDVAVSDPRVFLSWSPAGAARLLESPRSATGYRLSEGEELEANFTLDIEEPGTLFFTVTAEGREADTGKWVLAQPVTLELTVLPPPDLELKLTLESATAIVGEEVPFVLQVINRGSVAAASLSPSFAVSRGRASFKPLKPLFQSVPAASVGVFRGGLVPEEEGELDLTARVTFRGRLGGTLSEVASAPGRLLAIPAPALEMYCLTERIPSGPGKLEFLLRNGGKEGLALSRGDLRISGDGYDLDADLLGGETLALGAGKELRAAVEIDPEAGADPYWLLAGLQFAGNIEPTGLGFSGSLAQRPVALVYPPARRFVLVEPEGPFMPPLDPVLWIEWTTTVAGKSGLAVVTSSGEMVRELVKFGQMQPGLHSAEWHGKTDKGRLVKPGNYILRLAGPASGTSIWPAGAAWAADRPIEVQSP